MNDDYLWDKSGEPDPDVKELEDILGALRYQPRPLEFPEDVKVRQRSSYYPFMAIAATVVLALVAAGLWFGLKSSKTPNNSVAIKSDDVAPAPQPTIEQKKTETEQTAANGPTIRKRVVRHTATNPTLIARKQRERQEALAAKEQLLIALRLASEKLGEAQRKTQVPAHPNQIRNQHKIG